MSSTPPPSTSSSSAPPSVPSGPPRDASRAAPLRAAVPIQRRSIPGRRLLVGLLILLAAAVIPAVVFPTLMCRQPDPELADLGSVGAFAFTDERGQPFTDAALRGQVTIVSMLFTRCDSICPVTTMKMEKLQEKTFDVGGQIKLASFSVDPNYDTPERLTEYARRYHADPARWRFITGDDAAIQKLIAGPFMSAAVADGVTQSGAPSIQHSGYFFLIDATGHVRGTYDSNEIQRLDELVRDARYLVRTGARPQT